jgi:hypothetical protein
MQALNSDGKCEPGREHANEHFGLVTLIQKATQQQPPGFSGTSSLTLQPRKPMGSCLGTAQRQPGLGTMQRPQLTLVVARQHQHMLRWRHIRADDVFALLHPPPDPLKVATKCGLSPMAQHTVGTVYLRCRAWRPAYACSSGWGNGLRQTDRANSSPGSLAGPRHATEK